MKKFLICTIIALVISSPVYAGLAPLNPAFIKHNSVKSAGVNTNLVTGYSPSPIDLSHLKNNPPRIADDLIIPASYDLRDYGRVTPIRNQNPFGTCWIFGSLAAVESNYLTHVVNHDGKVDGSLIDASGDVHFSELHVGWYTKTNPDKSQRTDLNIPVRIKPGMYNMVDGVPSQCLAYYARLDGPVLDSEMPYLSYEVLSNDAGINRDVLFELARAGALPTYEQFQALTLARTGKKFLPEPYVYADAIETKVRLTDALYGTQQPLVGNNFLDQPGYIIEEYTKRLIMEHGAVNIAYHHANTEQDRISHDIEHPYAFFYSGANSGDANHAVSLIGWDDNFPREKFPEDDRPSRNGAWIMRNNWSTAWGNEGYCYMSYEQPIVEGIAHIVEDLPANLKIYDYDPLGWCNAYGKDRAKTMWAANVFKVKSEGESLESIAFYTTDNNTVCEWEIYYDLGTERPTNSPYALGAVKITGSQTFPYAGYHTVKLAQQIALTKGHYFSVVIKFANPVCEFPAAVETRINNYSGFANIHDFESWFSANGTDWEDGASIEGYSTLEDENVLASIPINACIKAFVLDSVNDSELPEDSKSILGIPVEDYLADIVDKTARNSLPDEPLTERLLIVPASRDNSVKFEEGTQVGFYLVNRTIEIEYVRNYQVEDDTRYPTGMGVTEDTGYSPLFPVGYEPNSFWACNDKEDDYMGIEFPVYGRFVETADKDGNIYLDVDALKYSDGTTGAIPKGYYDLVYFAGEFRGKIRIRLNATTINETPSVSHGSSGGCEVAASAGMLILLLGLVVRFKA